MNKLNSSVLIITSIVAVFFAAAGFFGGMQYQKSQRGAGFAQFQGRGNGQNSRFESNGGNRPVIGDIIAQDDKSITVKMPDGSSKIVLLSDSTTVSKTDTGTKSDLKVGDKVGVFGTDNSDGSVTAQSIQLNPMFGRQMGGQAASPSPAK